MGEAPAPLKRIYLLQSGGDLPEISQVEMSHGLVALASNTFLLDPDDHAALGAHFSRLSELAATNPCRALAYPRDFDFLPRVLEAICADLDDVVG